MVKTYDVAIIGGGIVGLSAAIYCGRLDLNCVVLAKEPRGTLVKTHLVENYPGFKSISGFDLTGKVLDHAKEYKENVDFVNKEVVDIKWSKQECFKVYTKKEQFHAKNVLIATGSDWKKLNAPGETEFSNRGVHYCALCDAPFYKNKIVAVVGGGDSAAKEALLLSKYAKKVYLIVRSTLKAEPINTERIEKEKKIKVIEGIQIKKIQGSKSVESISVSKKVQGKSEIIVDGVFVDIGHVPNSELAKGLGVKTNKKGEIIINKSSKTNKKGVYAAGDVANTEFKQAITGVGEAVKAVYEIYERTGKDVECM